MGPAESFARSLLSELRKRGNHWMPTFQRGTPEQLAETLATRLQHLWLIAVTMADFSASDEPRQDYGLPRRGTSIHGVTGSGTGAMEAWMFRDRTQFLWGMLAGASLMALFGSGADWPARAWAAANPPSRATSASKIVLENPRVRVKEAIFPPGAVDPGMHTHDLAHVGVILTAGKLVFAEPGKPSETVTFDVGSVGFREANVTHQVTNPGPTPMRVIEVELK